MSTETYDASVAAQTYISTQEFSPYGSGSQPILLHTDDQNTDESSVFDQLDLLLGEAAYCTSFDEDYSVSLTDMFLDDMGGNEFDSLKFDSLSAIL